MFEKFKNISKNSISSRTQKKYENRSMCFRVTLLLSTKLQVIYFLYRGIVFIPKQTFSKKNVTKKIVWWQLPRPALIRGPGEFGFSATQIRSTAVDGMILNVAGRRNMFVKKNRAQTIPLLPKIQIWIMKDRGLMKIRRQLRQNLARLDGTLSPENV